MSKRAVVKEFKERIKFKPYWSFYKEDSKHT